MSRSIVGHVLIVAGVRAGCQCGVFWMKCADPYTPAGCESGTDPAPLIISVTQPQQKMLPEASLDPESVTMSNTIPVFCIRLTFKS